MAIRVVARFDEEAGASGEDVWDPEDTKSTEELAVAGSKQSKRAYEVALKTIQDLAREVRAWFVEGSEPFASTCHAFVCKIYIYDIYCVPQLLHASHITMES